MNLVASSLRRPITVIVLVIAVVPGAGLAVHRMARDIFPTLTQDFLSLTPVLNGMPQSCHAAIHPSVRQTLQARALQF